MVPNAQGLVGAVSTLKCPYCGIKGDTSDARQFDPIGTPIGGDPLYGCRECQSMLLLVPGRIRPSFRNVRPDAGDAMMLALPRNQPVDAMPKVLTAAARTMFRSEPFTTTRRELVEEWGQDF